MNILKICAASATASLSMYAANAGATSVTFDLGPSIQDYVLYGQGAYAAGLGSFTNQQGSETFDVGTDTATETLTGLISGSTDTTYASGSYSLITTFMGMPIGSGGDEIQAYSNSSNPNYFFYNFLDPSVDMTLYLTGTPGGSLTVPLVTNGMFDAGFSFTNVTATCTGVTSCSQNNVGLTPGATYSGPVTISVTVESATLPAAVPESSTWLMMLLGFGMVGFIARARRQTVSVIYA